MVSYYVRGIVSFFLTRGLDMVEARNVVSPNTFHARRDGAVTCLSHSACEREKVGEWKINLLPQEVRDVFEHHQYWKLRTGQLQTKYGILGLIWIL